MGLRIAALAALVGLASSVALSAPAEAGWKWKKMRWEPKHGQEFRSPYAHPAPGVYGHGGYGHNRHGGGYGYGRYGYDRYSYGRPYGDAATGYGPRHGFEW